MPTKTRKKKKPKPRGVPFAGERAKAASAKAAEARRLKREAALAGQASLTPTSPDNTGQLLGLIDRLLGEPQAEPVRKNLVVRRKLLVRLRERPALWKRVRAICRQKVVLYTNWFVWQYNPLKPGGEVGPFVLYDFQITALLDSPETTERKGLVWCVDQGVSCRVQKSREMGITWLVLILQDWKCRFYDWQKWLDISRSADAVDAPGDSDSLMWKLDFIHNNLPAMLQGMRREKKERKRYHIAYPGSNSLATGQASTGKAGVGGRGHVAVVDEFQAIVEDKEIRQRTASTVRCRIFIGTHQGTGTEFYRLGNTPEIADITIHWHRHPDKNQGLYSYDTEAKVLRFWEYVPGKGLKELRGPTYRYAADFEFDMTGAPTGGPNPGLRSPWYDAKAKEIGTAREVAQELDIDPAGSKSKPFDPLLIHHLKHLCRLPDWEGDLVHDNQGWPLQLLEQKGGPLKLWCKLVDGKPPPGTYFLGSDVSGGIGATPSCASVGNGETGEKVARYANAHIAPDKFGIYCAALCRLFVGAKAAWEHAGPGVQFYKAMTEQAGYWNLYGMGEEERQVNRTGPRSPGFRPSGVSKNMMLLGYNLALTNGDFCNYDEAALDECLEFQYDSQGKIIHAGEVGADPSVARENHGDNVIADALACLLMLGGGKLVSRQKPPPPPVQAEENVLCVAGRQRLRRQQEEEDWE